MRKLIQREIEAAFSRHAQPIWFRLLNYASLGAFIYFFRNNPLFWWIALFMFFGGVGLHLFYRYKTKSWTQSYGAWNYEKNKPKSE